MFILRLQGLGHTASALDIRNFFAGLQIPPGGVHIIGGNEGTAFLSFLSDEDARMAMAKTGQALCESTIKLFLSSKTEMAQVIEQARNQSSAPPSSTNPTPSVVLPHMPPQPNPELQKPIASTLPQQQQQQQPQSNNIWSTMSQSTPSATPDQSQSLANSFLTQQMQAAGLTQMPMGFQNMFPGFPNPQQMFSMGNLGAMSGLSGVVPTGVAPTSQQQLPQAPAQVQPASGQSQNVSQPFGAQNNPGGGSYQQFTPSTSTNSAPNPFLFNIPPPSMQGSQDPFSAHLFQTMGGGGGSVLPQSNNNNANSGSSSSQVQMQMPQGLNPFAMNSNMGMNQSSQQSKQPPQQQQQGVGGGMGSRFPQQGGGGPGFGNAQQQLGSPGLGFNNSQMIRPGQGQPGQGFGNGGMNSRPMGGAGRGMGSPMNRPPFGMRAQGQGMRPQGLRGPSPHGNLRDLRDDVGIGRGGGIGGQAPFNNRDRDLREGFHRRRSRSRSRERSSRDKDMRERRRRSRSRSRSRDKDRRRVRTRSRSRSRERRRRSRERRERDEKEPRKKVDGSSSSDKIDVPHEGSRSSIVESGDEGTTSTEEHPAVKLSGVPTDASFREIREFLRVDLQGGSECVVRDYDGGLAYVKLAKPSDYGRVLRQNGKKIQNGVISVQPYDLGGWESRNAELGNKITPRKEVKDREREPESHRRDRDNRRHSRFSSGNCLIVRGIPPQITEKDFQERLLRELPFLDLIITPGADPATGKPQGIGYIHFESAEIANQGLGQIVTSREGSSLQVEFCELADVNRARRARENVGGRGDGRNQPETKSLFDLDTRLDNETCLVALSGVPPNISQRDVVDFFSDIGIIPLNVDFRSDGKGQYIVCEFQEARQAFKATTKDGMSFGRNVVGVKLFGGGGGGGGGGFVGAPAGSPGGFGPRGSRPGGGPRGPRFNPPFNNSHMSNGSNGRGPRMGLRGPSGGGGGNYDPSEGNTNPSEGLFTKPGCVLGLTNVPFKASMDDILQYLGDVLKINMSANRLIRRFNEFQKPTGDARIAFDTPMEAKLALDRLEGTSMWNRQIQFTQF